MIDSCQSSGVARYSDQPPECPHGTVRAPVAQVIARFWANPPSGGHLGSSRPMKTLLGGLEPDPDESHGSIRGIAQQER